MSVTAISVLARFLHFASTTLPAPIDGLLGSLLALRQLLAFLSLWGLWLWINPLLVLLVLSLLIVRFRACVRREDHGWFIRDWLLGLLWIEFALHNVLLDANPDLATLYAGTVPLALVSTPLASGRRRHVRFTVACAGVFVLWLATSPSRPAIWSGLVWVLVLGSLRYLRFAKRRDLLTLLIGAMLFVQLAFISIPAPQALRDHGGHLLGRGRAGAFCEPPGRDSVIATVSNCEGGRSCLKDYIAEYSLRDLSLRRKHRLFDDAFYGRMLSLACLEDRVVVGMAHVAPDLQPDGIEWAMSFTFGPPPVITKRIPGLSHGGTRHVHDVARNASYFTEEASNRVTRIVWGPDEVSSTEFTLGDGKSVHTDVGAISERRDSLFFAEWIFGSKVFELDGATLAIKAVYRTNNGTFSLTVDDELDRLIVANLWGIGVIDLSTGAVIHRKPTEFGARMPVIDARRNLVYVTSSYGFNVRVYDRQSFELLGTIPVGHGARHAYLSRDGRYFFATNGAQHFYWDADDLAARFRPSTR
jgi:hypothetical protein